MLIRPEGGLVRTWARGTCEGYEKQEEQGERRRRWVSHGDCERRDARRRLSPLRPSLPPTHTRPGVSHKLLFIISYSL